MSRYLPKNTKTGDFNTQRTLSGSFFVIPERLASIRAVVLAFTANKQTNKQTNKRTLSIIYIDYNKIYNGDRPNFCSHCSPKLTKEFAADTNEITKRCLGGDLDGISIVCLRNEGFPTFCLCLTMGRHLGFTEKLRNLRSRRLFGTPPGAMLRRPFRYRHSFMYADVCDISYIAESVASWEKESGSVAKLWASTIRFGYYAILTVT